MAAVNSHLFVAYQPPMTAPYAARDTWSLVAESLRRPYRVTIPMILLAGMVPFYIFIAAEARTRPVHIPALDLDRAIPLQPTWALVYGALYLFLILLPVFVVRHDDLIRRTVFAFLSVWITAYVCFLIYPTVAPRPEQVTGNGFGAWGLRTLYDADPPYNCFPSLHVAHSFVAALASYRVHRSLGVIAGACATLVALSTLFTKQHYVADVVVGALMAFAAYRVFLRGFSRDNVPELDRRLAPVFGVGLFVVACIGLGGFWMFYKLMS